MIHYVEGKVLLEGQPVDPKFGEFPEVKNDQVLQTEEGRAEVLLTPGVFLRISENSSFKMLSNRLSDTSLEVLSGSTMFEVDELLKDNAITVRYKDATVSLSKRGLYRFDADAERLKVYDGDAEAIYGDKTVQVHKGRQVALDETLTASNFDLKDTDAFYNWASRRSEYVAAANVSSARAAGTSGVGTAGCGGFAANNGTLCNGSYGSYGNYGYGSPYGMWAWNPYYGMFTYLPGMGYGYSPFGWALYSPYTVGSLFVPGLYSPYATGAPRYTNTASGPTALGGARQSPASLSSAPTPLRASNTGAISSSAGNSSTGARISGTSSSGGGSVGGGSIGGARGSSAGGGHR
jgi:FecR protein